MRDSCQHALEKRCFKSGSGLCHEVRTCLRRADTLEHPLTEEQAQHHSGLNCSPETTAHIIHDQRHVKFTWRWAAGREKHLLSNTSSTETRLFFTGIVRKPRKKSHYVSRLKLLLVCAVLSPAMCEGKFRILTKAVTNSGVKWEKEYLDTAYNLSQPSPLLHNHLSMH